MASTNCNPSVVVMRHVDVQFSENRRCTFASLRSNPSLGRSDSDHPHGRPCGEDTSSSYESKLVISENSSVVTTACNSVNRLETAGAFHQS